MLSDNIHITHHSLAGVRTRSSPSLISIHFNSNSIQSTSINSTSLPFLFSSSLRMLTTEAIQNVVHSTPNKTALSCISKQTETNTPTIASFSYRQVWNLATAIAHDLRCLFDATDSEPHSKQKQLRVAVLIEEGYLLPISELAVLLSSPRAVVVPLDIGDPRLSSFLKDAQPQILIVRYDSDIQQLEAATTQLHERSWKFFSVEKFGKKTLYERTTEDLSRMHMDGMTEFGGGSDVSHIFFTSGSTSKPKGCVSTHDALSAYCLSKNKMHCVTDSDVCFVASPPTFDPSFGDFMATWSAGATVAIAPRTLLFTSLAACLNLASATHILTTPSLFETLSASEPEDFPTLKVVALGGEAMSSSTVDKWSEKVMLLNTYGVTECCVYQSVRCIKSGSCHKELGDPMEGTKWVVMTSEDATDMAASSPETMVEVRSDDDGAIGELWICGAQVGMGYLNRPTLTSQKFIDHSEFGKCFRTGDVVQASGNGNWKLLGRYDGQIKLRGQRIEVGEIEESLLTAATSQLLQSITVVLHECKQLVAYCRPTTSETSASELGSSSEAHLMIDLLRFLCERALPRHMVPSRFILLDDPPKTPSGKIARSQLMKRPLPPLSAGNDEAIVTSSHGGWTEVVVATWIDVLGISKSQLDQSAHFLELGGESLSALRVCKRLSELRRKRPLSTSDASESHLDTVPTKHVDGGNTTVFGELLGALAPIELLKKPKLNDFAAHLCASLGAFDTTSTTNSDHQPKESNDLFKLNRERPVGTKETLELSSSENVADIEMAMLYRAASIGALSIAEVLLTTRGLDANGITPISRKENAFELTSRSKKSDFPKSQKTTSARETKSAKKSPSSPSNKSLDHQAPIHQACANGHAAVVELLIKHGASVNISDPNGLTPLMAASANGPVALLKLLLEAKSRFNVKDTDGQTVLHHAARRGASGKVLDFLLDVCDAGGLAAQDGRSGKGGVQRSKTSSAQLTVDAVDRWGRTPLHWATVNGHRDVVVRLLDRNADRKRPDNENETPLQIAERRARCGAAERPDGMVASVFGDIAKILGGSGSTKRVSKYK